MIVIPIATKEALLALSWRFLGDNAERIEKLCRIWDCPPTQLLEWVLKEGLEQLEAHTGMIEGCTVRAAIAHVIEED